MALTGIYTVPFKGLSVKYCANQRSGSHKGTFNNVRRDDLHDGDISLQLPQSFKFSVPYAN